MGSRGQAIKAGGFKEYHYHTIMRYNKVRFIVQNDGKSIKLPEMSNSRWAVYTTIGKNGKIKSVSFYNGSRKKFKEIDYHDHKGLKPHVHILDPETGLRNDSLFPPRKPTSYELRRLKRIENFYERHTLRDKAINYYRSK